MLKKSPENAPKMNPGGSKIDPEGSKIDPGGSKIDPGGSKIDPGGSRIDPGGSKIDPGGSGKSQTRPKNVFVIWGVLRGLFWEVFFLPKIAAKS